MLFLLPLVRVKQIMYNHLKRLMSIGLLILHLTSTYVQVFLLNQSKYLRKLLFCDSPLPFTITSVPQLRPSWAHVQHPRQYGLCLRVIHRAQTNWPIPHTKAAEPRIPSLPSVHPHNESLGRLLSGIDILSIHRTSQLFINPAIAPSVSSMISENLNRISHICYHSHHTAWMDLNPSHIYLSPSPNQSLPIVLDSGASTSISPCKSDFTCLKACSSTISGMNSTT